MDVVRRAAHLSDYSYWDANPEHYEPPSASGGLRETLRNLFCHHGHMRLSNGEEDVEETEARERGRERWRHGLSDWERLSDSETDAQAVLCYDQRSDTSWAAFRGTNCVRDVLYDMDVALVAPPHGGEGRVHNGFRRQYCALRERVMDYIVHRHPGSAAVLTGHSLGGALAVLSAAELRGILPRGATRCITFGAPRVGDSRFAAAQHEGALRVVHRGDPVERLPPRLFFKHAGPALAIGGGQPATPPTAAGSETADDPLWRCLDLPVPCAFMEHDMAAYMRALAREESYYIWFGR